MFIALLRQCNYEEICLVLKRSDENTGPVMAGDYLSAIRDFAISQGISANSLLAGSRVDLGTLLSPPKYLDAGELQQIGSNFVSLLDNPMSAAVAFGRSLAFGYHGALGVAVQGSKTLLDVGETLIKFAYIRSTTKQLEWKLSDQNIAIRIWEEPVEHNKSNEFVQQFFNLATLVSLQHALLQLLSGNTLSGDMIIHIPACEPADFPFDTLKPAQVLFNQEDFRLIFPEGWGQLPLLASNQELANIALHHCESELKELSSQDLVSGIRDLIWHISQNPPSMEEVAERFHMSPSSLRRRLKEEDTTYSQLKADVLCDKAQVLLSETSLSIEDISYQLGFNDPSNFTKAFKGWLGMTPKYFRQT